ncbi:MAG: IS200/IS605 family transposase [Bacteroidaceae bacterium]|nr:IS200/IS605 family transposase [Bacteroidaceae bacterium]
MAYTKLIYHIVFRPQNNAPAIAEAHERDLYMYIYGFCKNHQCVLYRIGGMPDHIHMLVGMHPSIAIASFVHDLKIATGNFMRSHHDMFPLFNGWERSYGAFTYAEADKDRVIEYIKNQKEHHKHISARDEMIAFLKEYGIEYDEKYI